MRWEGEGGEDRKGGGGGKGKVERIERGGGEAGVDC